MVGSAAAGRTQRCNMCSEGRRQSAETVHTDRGTTGATDHGVGEGRREDLTLGRTQYAPQPTDPPIGAPQVTSGDA
jgi:hypothetical protein